MMDTVAKPDHNGNGKPANGSRLNGLLDGPEIDPEWVGAFCAELADDSPAAPPDLEPRRRPAPAKRKDDDDDDDKAVDNTAKAAELEICVIGSMFADPLCISAVRAILSANDFIGGPRFGDGLIFQAILDLVDAGSAIDAVLVRSSLDAGKLHDAGGLDHFYDLLNCVPSAAHAVHYARKVKALSAKRRLWKLTTDAAAASCNGQSASTIAQRLVADLAAVTSATDTFISAGELIRNFPELHAALIRGVLRVGEVCNLISTSKGRKSWLVLAIALCVATGRQLFGKFQCERGRVLVFDNELHPPTIAHRLKAVAAAMGIEPAEYQDRIVFRTLRGQQFDVLDLRRECSGIEHGRFSLVVADALYKMLPQGTDENDNAAMAAVYAILDSVALRTGAAVLVVHHSSKGGQASKYAVDVGSGAGSIARAPDTIIAIREHATDGAVVVDVVARNWPPIPRFGLKWEHPVWALADDLDLDDLREGGRRRAAKPVREPMTPERFAETFITNEPQLRETISQTASLAALTKTEAKQFIRACVGSGLAYEWVYANPSTPHRYAKTEQPVFDTGKTPKTPRKRLRK